MLDLFFVFIRASLLQEIRQRKVHVQNSLFVCRVVLCIQKQGS